MVTVECRNANPDELATFLATATDPDDDDIAGFTWRLNGQVVDGETADALQIRVAEGDIVTVTATDSGDATSAQVQAPCTPVGENQPPTVTVECRGATVPGQEATFLASAIDPNGDEIASYTWMVNDNEVTGQNGPSLTVIVNEGDVVTVTATDTGGAESTEATAPCTPVTNNQPPEVTIDCPDELVDGREATFRATGTDPDGDDLTYTWFVDGRPVADVTGDQLTITWADTTNVSVQVTDANGASSDVVASDCGPDNEPPAVAMECLGSITPGARAVFSATATDPDGDTISFSWFVNDVRVPGISGPLLSALVEEGDVITVVATDARGAASAPVEAPCAPISENEAPSVTVDCPDSLTPGEEATFTATGTDPDGEDDNLVYTWFVNDVAQTETGDAFTFAYSAGDEVAVKVTDEGGTSTVPETADCTEQNEPPTVSLICQGDLTPGEPATFLADGNDPEGGELTYRWLLNDRVVPGQTGPELRIVVQLGDVISIVASDEAGLDSEEATAPCTPVSENAAPEVTVECPPELSDGEEAVFTATGTDPDGDELIYTWYVNGDEVDDQNGPTLTVTYSDGDRISVRVTDTDGASSDEVTAECTDENRPPTVRIDCPAIVVFGEPTRLVANGTDPDGDRLSYIWKRNGEVVDGATGSVLTTIVDRDDRLTVTVLDGRGGMSAETSVDCNSGSRPRITVACPPELTFGKPAEFVATVTDEDGDSVENGRITVVWKVDGKLVTGTSGSSATLTLKQGQRVDVAAIDASGLVNAAMEPISCTGIVLRGPGSNGGATNGS
ncbi:MAG: hypothetical protein KDB24_11105, partial [Microthrixaceae bacterium]|nr:hypothetical protein [Microthrixaceae bacterium]